MKELSIVQKMKVIKLFLSGDTFDEIAVEVGISKGSVVNIINEFREGILPVPPGMVEFVDELRKLVIDMKKHHTTVTQMKKYEKIHHNLKEMGVSIEQVDTWLGVCQDIAAPSVSNKQFVQAAIQLAQQMGESGLSYHEALADYQEKLKTLNQLNKAIGKKTEELDQVKSHIEEKKKKASKDIEVIAENKKAAVDEYLKKKADLDSQFEKLLAEHNLNLEKINIVDAILEQDYSEANLSHDDIYQIVKGLLKAGGLQSYIKQLEGKVNVLETRISKLTKQKAEFQTSVDKLGNTNNKLLASLTENGSKDQYLTKRINVQLDKLATMEEKMAANMELIDTCRLILKTLLTPEAVSNDELERLTRLIFFVRQRRLGIDPKKAFFVKNNMVYECQVPRWHLYRWEYGINIKDVQQKLALCLIPGVADKFVPKLEHDFKEMVARISQLETSMMK